MLTRITQTFSPFKPSSLCFPFSGCYVLSTFSCLHPHLSSCTPNHGRSATGEKSVDEGLGSIGDAHEISSGGRNSPESVSDGHRRLDPELLHFLVCPLSKQPLRYDSSRSELVNDELGVAYPVVDGVPHLVPSLGRVVEEEQP
eukprot:TRINITY_DN949_c0_g1_i1.p1 TRINITY_DN949_c0_g1~~TRINITY_DN949_c0_g1_i1.p1  ORF type:complete len:143 (-),score=15.34 TRINITY_DN949_c0_g1_i1:243-671(-)